MATKKTKNPLGEFEGRDVLQATLIITKTGDGLSTMMEIEPAAWHQGTKLHVVMEVDLTKIRFDQIKGTDAMKRVHIGEAGTIAIVDASVVADVMAQQQKKNEEKAGTMRLPGTTPGDGDEPDDE